jgi:hypothetical protein
MLTIRDAQLAALAASRGGAASQPCPLAVHWVEVELVGEDDRPVPGARFRLRDGAGAVVAEASLDGDGCARVEGLRPGRYEVQFPELDEEAWEAL